MTVGYGAGLQFAVIWRLSSDGYPAGLAGTLANGNTAQAYLSTDVRSAVFNVLAATTVDVTGGDKPKVASFTFGGRQLSSFEVVIPRCDPTLIAALTSSAVDTTSNSNFTLYSTNPNRESPVLGGLLLQQRYQPVNGTDSGMKVRTLAIPRAELSIRTGGMDFQTPSDVTLTVTPLMSTRSAHGQLFSALNMDLVENRADHYELISNNPLHIVSFRGNASLTSVTAAYRPTSSVITLGATPNWYTLNGTATALSAVNTSTGVMTFTAAPAAASWNVIMYETGFVPV